MSPKHTRRSFLGMTGSAIATLTAGVTIVSASETEDRYIVDTRSVSTKDATGIEIIHDLDQIDIAVVRGSESDVADLRAAPDVRFKLDIPVTERSYGEVTDEPLFRLQWDKQAQRIPIVHEYTRGEGSRVSIIDTGILETHPDLDGPLNVELSRNFTDDGGDHNPVNGLDHGTHVGGIVAAANNDRGVIGTAPETDLVDCRVFSGSFATFGDILAAIYYSAKIECDAANMSLGAYPLPLDSEQTQMFIEAIERAAAFANEQGTLLVAAAGNDSANLDEDGNVISLPNEAENVMSISATGPIGYRWDDPAYLPDDYYIALSRLRKPTTQPAFYTNYGSEAVDVSAPGGNADLDAIGTGVPWYYDLVLSSAFVVEDGEQVPAYGWKAGTSMAAPEVTGAAALVRSRNPNATPDQVRSLIEETAEDIPPQEYRGEGHLFTLRAVLTPIIDI
jgi:subtilisin family serine protease